MRLRWIIACVLGEAVGISAVAATYAALDRSILPGGSAWILAAGAWEGLCLGVAQAIVLQRIGVKPIAWVLLTVLAAIVGYALSLLGGAGAQQNGGSAEPPLVLLIALGGAMGVAMGALMGLGQWSAARAEIGLGKWVVANAIGWAPAMAVIMLAASSAQPEWSLGVVSLFGAAAGAAAGLLVGVSAAIALPRRTIEE